jgi:hypothetical protein
MESPAYGDPLSADGHFYHASATTKPKATPRMMVEAKVVTNPVNDIPSAIIDTAPLPSETLRVVIVVTLSARRPRAGLRESRCGHARQSNG